MENTRHAKNQKNCILNENNKPTEAHPEMNQILDLFDRDFKIDIIKMTQ